MSAYLLKGFGIISCGIDFIMEIEEIIAQNADIFRVGIYEQNAERIHGVQFRVAVTMNVFLTGKNLSKNMPYVKVFLQKESREKSRLHIYHRRCRFCSGGCSEEQLLNLRQEFGAASRFLLHREVKEAVIEIFKIGERNLGRPGWIKIGFLEQPGSLEPTGTAAAFCFAPEKERYLVLQGIAVKHHPDLITGQIKISQAGFAAIAVCRKGQRGQVGLAPLMVFLRNRTADQQSVFHLVVGALFAEIQQSGPHRLLKLIGKDGIKGVQIFQFPGAARAALDVGLDLLSCPCRGQFVKRI
ncbi:MAG TPA: hypothetical protein PKI90_11655 [bacterium]|nr:hypothetical protein [bacterium]